MSDRVLASQTAVTSVRKLQQLITGPLLQEIENLNREGQVLSQPNVWDGRLAEEFRSNWPQTYNALKKAQQELEQLRSNIDRITTNILQAGGNA